MENYQKVRVKLRNRQPNKLKSTAKFKTRTVLRITNRNFKHEELPHELFPTTRQKTKIRKAIAKYVYRHKS